MGSTNEWGNRIPDHCLTAIFESLPLQTRLDAGLVCQRWLRHGLCAPQLWRSVTFVFERGFDNDRYQIGLVRRFGKHFRAVTIRLNQFEIENRLLAVECLKEISQLDARQIRHLRIVCTGENPLFYGGAELIEALTHFAQSNHLTETLQSLDLSKFPFSLTDDTVLAFGDHFKTIRYLDLQSRCLVCKITPDAIEQLVTHSVNLVDLRVFHSSLSDSVLDALAEHCAKSLRHLSVLAKRQELIAANDLSDIAWLHLTDSVQQAAAAGNGPNIETDQSTALKVSLVFDYTCPINKIRTICKASVPVHACNVESYTIADQILRLIGETYSDSLREMTVRSQPDNVFEQALLAFVDVCDHLKQLHVLCPLKAQTISQIHAKRPLLTKPECCTLSGQDEQFCPWLYDRVLDEIRTNAGWPRQ